MIPVDSFVSWQKIEIWVSTNFNVLLIFLTYLNYFSTKNNIATKCISQIYKASFHLFCP